MYKVLLVDDEELLVESLAKTFPWKNFECEVVGTALNGITALDAYRNLRPDIVVTDIKMPDMDGIAFLEEIFAERGTDEVIVLSGFDDFNYVQNALRYKAFHYLLKPLDREELKDVIDKAIKEIVKKKETETTKWKTFLFDHAFKRSETNEQTELFSSFGTMIVKYLEDGNVRDEHSDNHFLFTYPLSNKELLIIGAGDSTEDRLLSLAEDLLSKNKHAIASLGPITGFVEELSDSLEGAQLFLEKQQFIDQRLVTQGVYDEYRCLETESLSALHDAKRYIEKHANQPLRNDDVAKRFAFSPSYFSTIFKQVHGISFSEHLKQTRINQACELLKETNKPAYEIANAVGYEDQRYFSQVFKKETGQTPSQYRKSHFPPS
ncbi:helix-turn-helix domain-containing protein [Salipaludibacillus sp. HK11]|uniref:response regulator transcription factor n=1 Tax=Salipaludibacillus sp. HK11 TaxID=3394320 RepID=UPI0039FBC678